jgi:AcrR family transcriptional regulator
MPFEAPSPDTSRSDAKRRAIIAVARDVFLAQGYAASSMSEIAAKLGGSKGTLYNYFRSKEELFGAFIAETCQGHAVAAFDNLSPFGAGGDVREGMIALGVALLEILQDDHIVAVHRLVVAEAGRFPEIGQMFYQAGPRKGEVRFADFFQMAMDAGHVPPGDPWMLGQRLKDLVMSDVYLKRMWGMPRAMNAAQQREHVAESVDLFMRAFGISPA